MKSAVEIEFIKLLIGNGSEVVLVASTCNDENLLDLAAHAYKYKTKLTLTAVSYQRRAIYEELSALYGSHLKLVFGDRVS